MENKELPEIGFKKDDKEKKKGFLPWLRQKLGLGGPSSLGAASEEANIVNIGRSLSTMGRFGTAKSAGLFGLLAGKAGALITLGIVTAAIGTTLYFKNSPSPSEMAANSIGDGAITKGSQYVPAIERVKGNVSSLDAFKEANKGLSLDEEKKQDEAKNQKNEDKDAEQENKDANQDQSQKDQPENTPGGANGFLAGIMPKLQGVNFPGLSSDIGGGGNKMQIGGFANKFGQGAFGPKVEFSKVGSGFGTPKLEPAKNKLLPMRTAKKIPVKSQIAQKVGYGKKALSQAMGVQYMQRQGPGNTIEQLAGQQNKAWEGQTGGGDVQTGVGAGEGQDPGIVTTPSIDNPAPSGGIADYNPSSVPEVPNKIEDNPWGNILSQCMTFLIMAALLSFLASKLIQSAYKSLPAPWAYALLALGIIMAIAALGMAIKVVMNAISLMSTYGQGLLGAVYLIAGLAAVGGALAAMAGAFSWGQGIAGATMYFAGAAGILAMLASMAIAPNAQKKSIEDKQKQYEECIKNGGTWDDKANNSLGECKK